ncbi:MAG TPA: Ppx/GppA phosphatase family protein [Phycisphaerae bacterium]|nr:Ppx/GppA phosphatase family protein [Phycisphaerae bacterium]
MKFGAIDVGTNSIHLVMVEVSPEGDFRILGRDKEMVQLGRGGFVEHVLTERAMEDGLACLTRFAKLARLKGVGRLRAVATSAVREARNGGDFVQRVRRALGLELHVLSTEEEARLIYLAVRHAVNLGNDDHLVVDVGGGSVEVIVGNANRPEVLFSAKLGALRLSELYLKKDPPAVEEIKALRRHVESALAALENRVGRRKFDRCLATSGTFEHLAEICTRRRGEEQSDTDVLRVSRAEIKTLLSDLIGTRRDELLKVPGMEARRVSTILPAATTLMALARMFDISQFEYCDMALREGIIIDHIASRRAHFLARATWPDPRTRSVVQLAERCGYNRAHAEQVQQLALSLFGQLAALHHLDDRYRDLLSYACLLHDVGYMISHKGHHKHSYYLIRNGGLQGFSEPEIEIIANIARYHRKAWPRKSHYSYQQLDREGRDAVCKLIPIIRLANALDRTHYSVADALDCRVNADRVEVLVHSGKDMELEMWTARRQCPLFEREYGVQVAVSLASNVKELQTCP